MKAYYLPFIVTLLIINYSLFAQSPEVDSLITVINTQRKTTSKVDNLNDLCWKLKDDFKKSKEYGMQALDLAKELEYKEGKALAYKNLGGIHYHQSKYAFAYNYYNESHKLYKELDDKDGIAKVVSNLGSIFHQQGEYAKAIEYFYQSLEIKIEQNDKVGIAKQYNRIGVVYFQQGEKNYESALEYFEKALKIFKELDDKIGIASSYYRLASIYTSYTEPKNDEALEYALKFLELSQEIDNKKLIAEANQIIGNIYLKQEKNEKAFINMNKSLELWDELGDLYGKAYIYFEIASYYNGIKDYKNAMEYLFKALDIVNQINAPEIEQAIYNQLYMIYNSTNKYKDALYYIKEYYTLRDTLKNEEMTSAITRASVKNEFNSQLKEQKLIQEKMELEHKAKEKRAKILMFAFLFGFVFMFGFATYIFMSLRNKRRANKLLEKQNIEINQQHKEILYQRDEILASITYAKRIQQAVLPSKEYANKILNKHFIFFKPRDIVSGDFFWIKQIRNFTIVATADCTGHGVPGAFMSMLGTSFLNETVTSRKLDNPADILQRLRKKIKKSLGQTGADSAPKDGMDLALYIINTEKKILQFAGAYNPLYIIREALTIENKKELQKKKKVKILNKKEFQNQTLIELKADRQPIGIYLKEKDFTTTTFQLKDGDKLYTFSDGFVDQFGGEKGGKFKSKQFKNLLLSMYEKTMPEQKIILENTFNNWISHTKKSGGTYDQIDDIIIIGIEIP